MIFRVPDPVWKHDEVMLRIEQPARQEQHACKLRPQELMPVATGAVQDEYRVRDAGRWRRARVCQGWCSGGAGKRVFRLTGSENPEA